MLAFGSQNAIDGRDVVVVLNQGPGDIVLVPPGWPHAVSNVMPFASWPGTTMTLGTSLPMLLFTGMLLARYPEGTQLETITWLLDQL